MFLAFHGGGKGKTTAALGTALRAWGHGMKVLYVGTMKTPHYLSEEVGEYRAMRRLGIDTVYLSDLHSPRALLQYALERGEQYDLVILDEALYAVRQGLLTEDDLRPLAALNAHVIVTGNHWSPRLEALADLATEMREVKHYHRWGVPAVRGLDW